MLISAASSSLGASFARNLNIPRIDSEAGALSAMQSNASAQTLPLTGEQSDDDEKIYTRPTPPAGVRYAPDEIRETLNDVKVRLEAALAHRATMPDQTVGQEAQAEEMARASAVQGFPGLEMALTLSVELTNHITKMMAEEDNPDRLTGLKDYLAHQIEQIARRSRDMLGAYDVQGELVGQREDGTYFVGDYSASYKGTALR